MPGTRHSYEISIDNGSVMEFDRKRVLELARSAQKTGKKVEIFVDGKRDEELSNKFNNKTEDTFSHEMRLTLSTLDYRVSSLAQEFSNGMTENDLYTEIDELRSKFAELCTMLEKRVGEKSDNATYGPFVAELAQVE